MHLIFLVANQAFVFIFGDDLRTADIIAMGNHGRFFDTREQAVYAANSCGLDVDIDGTVTLGQSATV